MTRLSVSLRNRYCTDLPTQSRPMLSIVLSWLVALDSQFRRIQASIDPPGRWP
jgi:hypothetical protein